MTSQKDVKDLLARAQATGWEYLGFDGRSHHQIRWPATGRILRIVGTPSGGRRSLENTEANIVRVSGVPLRPVPGPGRTKAQRRADQRRRESRTVTITGPAAVVDDRPDWREQLAARRLDVVIASSGCSWSDLMAGPAAEALTAFGIHRHLDYRKRDTVSARHSGYVIVLDTDLREDEATATVTALSMVRGVASVTPIHANLDQQIAAERRDIAWRQSLIDLARKGPAA
ncbi:hypothetical protein [Nocardia thailandica]|uniref:hypothetical protein n=1 Tax=Nocardia thailandica TaxID=257275 RepID=UPI0002DFB15A|nr:hypothetical protein [Nocardia thailandica]